MNRPFLVTIVERLRGESLSTFLRRRGQSAWEREDEKAGAEARRLAEELQGLFARVPEEGVDANPDRSAGKQDSKNPN